MLADLVYQFLERLRSEQGLDCRPTQNEHKWIKQCKLFANSCYGVCVTGGFAFTTRRTTSWK